MGSLRPTVVTRRLSENHDAKASAEARRPLSAMQLWLSCQKGRMLVVIPRLLLTPKSDGNRGGGKRIVRFWLGTEKEPQRNYVQGAAKGGRQKEFDHFFSFSGRFRSLFLMLLSLFSSLFCQAPFAGLLLRQGDM